MLDRLPWNYPRSLIACQLVCKSLKDVAHKLLWERVWYRPEVSSQVDHLVTADGGEGGLVRTFEFERVKDTPECVDLIDTIRKMPGLVELSIRQNIDGGELDLGVLARLQDLTHIFVEAEHVDLAVAGNPSVAELVFPQLKHLVLHGVRTRDSFGEDVLNEFFARCVPTLDTLTIARLEVSGKRILPSLTEAFLRQLHVLRLSIAEYELVQPSIYSTPTPIVAFLSERETRAMFEDMKRAPGRDGTRMSMLAQHLALPRDEILLDFPGDGPTAPALLLACVLVAVGNIKTIFLSQHLRINKPASPDFDLALLHQRALEAFMRYEDLRLACERKGVEMFFIDEEADVVQWPAWAQGDPVLRRLVGIADDCDARGM
ncbi:hypothetical protein JCM10450v2_003284 [Rhodotorula kratochvilovae]